MNNPILLRAVCRFLTIFTVANLFYLGGQPVSVGLFQPPLDKVAHFATFGLIAALLWLSMRRASLIFVIGVATIVGAADEIHQIFVPGRSAGWDDFAADIIAAITVATVMYCAGLYRELQAASTSDPDLYRD